MNVVKREVSWGDAIVVLLFRTPGGLKVLVELIQRQVGPTVGTRNTFAKLLRVQDPALLGPKDLWRAWLLLTILHEDPSDWGIGDNAVPPSINAEELTEHLQRSADDLVSERSSVQS